MSSQILLTSLHLAVLAVITWWRQPNLLSYPRFWAEEGSLYFSYAYGHSLLQNLFHAELGYYTFYHSIVTWLATLVPLESAPAVTTYAAFVVQLGIGCQVLWGEIPLLDSLGKRAAVLFLIPLICYGRTWLNTLGIHFWLGVSSFLLLIEVPERDGDRRDVFKGAVLAVAGLTGVTTCFMAPVFILKAAATKSRRFIRYSLILCACSLVQVLVFILAWQARDPGLGARLVYNDLQRLTVKILVYQFAEPFLGHLPFELPVGIIAGGWINEFAAAIGASPFSNELEAAATVAGFCLVLFLIFLFWYKRSDQEYRYVMLAFLLVFVLSTLLSLNMSAGPRYTFAPNAMLLVFAVSLWDDQRLKVAGRVMQALLLISLVMHAVEFRNSMYNLAYHDDWPKWTIEVERWRTVPGYRPRIWPPNWDMWLEK